MNTEIFCFENALLLLNTMSSVSCEWTGWPTDIKQIITTKQCLKISENAFKTVKLWHPFHAKQTWFWMELHIMINISAAQYLSVCQKQISCSVETFVVMVWSFYLMDNELMGAIWQRPAILLHQRNKGVAKQFLLSLVFSCQTTTHGHGIESKIHQHRQHGDKQKLMLWNQLFSDYAIQKNKLEKLNLMPSVHLFYF